MEDKRDVKFKVKTPLGNTVSTTEAYWNHLVSVKHPHIKGLEKDVIETLSSPDMIRKSKSNANVYLYYKEISYHGKNYHMCAVANNAEKFLITAYITDRVKEGVTVWTR